MNNFSKMYWGIIKPVDYQRKISSLSHKIRDLEYIIERKKQRLTEYQDAIIRRNEEIERLTKLLALAYNKDYVEALVKENEEIIKDIELVKIANKRLALDVIEEQKLNEMLSDELAILKSEEVKKACENFKWQKYFERMIEQGREQYDEIIKEEQEDQ